MEEFREREGGSGLGCFVLLALTTGAMILVLLLSQAFASMTGLDLSSMPSIGEGFSQNLVAYKWLQIVSAIITFILPAFLFSKYKTGTFTGYFRSENGLHIVPILLAGFAMLLSYPLLLVSMKLNSFLTLPESLRIVEELIRNMEDSAAELTTVFLTMDSFGSFALNMLMIGVLPAVGEELLFRGCIQKLLRKGIGNPHIAIFLAGFIFSFFHFQFYGFLPRLIMGVILGYLFYLSGNIWYPIIAHFLNNGFQVLMVYLGQMPLDDVSAPELPPLDLNYIGAALLSVLLITGVFTLYRNYFVRDGLG